MANTGQIIGSHRQELGETHVMNHNLVRDHIDSLLREGEALRAERLEAAHRSTADRTVGVRGGRFGPVRIRLGLWLVGVGSAVAGGDNDARETAGRAV